MAVGAVIFDWGGTLTPWHQIDHGELWRQACAAHFPGDQVAGIAAAICAAEQGLWQVSRDSGQSATLDHVFAQAGVAATEGLLESYYALWDPHTYTDPDVAPLLRYLRERGIRIGVLSNTMWPRTAHERVFRRDEVLSLIDGAVYSSEIPWVKPHAEAFRAAMATIGMTDPGECVYVGDRPYDDVHGAKRLGMRAVLVPNSDVPPFDAAVPDAVISRLSELTQHLDAW
jgi:putative hydrolase of the HAD superfamily